MRQKHLTVSSQWHVPLISEDGDATPIDVSFALTPLVATVPLPALKSTIGKRILVYPINIDSKPVLLVVYIYA